MSETKSIDFELPKGTRSYNLYKLHPPFRKLVDGYGYPGVILERVKDEKLQCHICGGWFDNLASHVLYEHKTKSEEYKKKFSLRQKDSLVCKKISEFRRALGSNAGNLEHLKKVSIIGIKTRQANKKKHAQNKSKASLQSKNTLAALNEKGICPDKLNYRFDVVYAQLGKQPTAHELKHYDEPCHTRIIQKFGTFNKYIEYRGLTPKQPLKIDKIPDIKLIAAIRNIYLKKGKVVARDFHSGNNSPSWTTIYERFGSLENALRESGIDPANWTMIG